MSAQPSRGHERVVEQGAHQPSTPVGLGFVVVYAGAYFALWMALLTPVIVTLAIRVQQIDPAGKAGSLSLVLGVGAFFALVSNPFFGKLSDRTASRFGMRRPWIAAGAMASTLGLLIIALAQSITGILIGWCLSQTAFNALLAVVVAVLPDQVPEEQRGRVSGVLGMCQSAAQVAGTFIAQQLAYSSFWMFMLPAAINLVACLALAVTLRDRTIDRSQVPPYSLGEFLRSFWVNPIKYSDFGWAWAGRFLLSMGLATLLSYQVFYLTDHLGRDPSSVPQLIFTSTLVLSACVVVSSYAGGWLSDRFRRRKVLVLASAATYSAGLFFVAMAGSFTAFLWAIVIAGIGQGIFFAVDLALVSAVLPEGGREAAKDMGVFNIANALPQSIAPAIAPIFLAIGSGNNYTALFTAAAIFTLLGALCVQPIKGVR